MSSKSLLIWMCIEVLVDQVEGELGGRTNQHLVDEAGQQSSHSIPGV